MIIEKISMQASKVNDYVTKGRQKLDASLSLPSGKVFASLIASFLATAFGLRFESEDGFLRYEYRPSREYTAKRLRETKEILSNFIQMYPIYGHLSQIGNAKIVGALWSCFGPPQDIYDDWKQSYSFYFDLTIQRQLMDNQFSNAILLLMEVCDWKGGPDIRLRMPIRGGKQEEILEDGKDLLTDEMRLYSIALGLSSLRIETYFVGFIKGYAESGPLHDFERTYPYGEYQYKEYG